MRRWESLKSLFYSEGADAALDGYPLLYRSPHCLTNFAGVAIAQMSYFQGANTRNTDAVLIGSSF